MHFGMLCGKLDVLSGRRAQGNKKGENDGTDNRP
jgi:hypothetical protein